MQDAEDNVEEVDEEEATEVGHQELMKRERKKNCQVARIPGLAAEDESSGDRTTKKNEEGDGEKDKPEYDKNGMKRRPTKAEERRRETRASPDCEKIAALKKTEMKSLRCYKRSAPGKPSKRP